MRKVLSELPGKQTKIAAGGWLAPARNCGVCFRDACGTEAAPYELVGGERRMLPRAGY